MNAPFPESAISSWSGYVYQGKVALYHSLVLIVGNQFPNFELQLDSTDDFAIYCEGKLISSHQVKAKANTHRTAYLGALEKSALVAGDRTIDTARFFHVAVQLDNSTDYTNANNVTVKFYLYGTNQYCALSQIEPLIKDCLSNIAISLGIQLTNTQIEYLYCTLSEMITRKVIEIHSINQVSGVTVASEAYKNRIPSDLFTSTIKGIDGDSELNISILKIRKIFLESLEIYVQQQEEEFDSAHFERLQSLFEHIFALNDEDLEKFYYSIQPSEAVLQHQNIETYSDLICEFIRAPILDSIPHYKDNNDEFYLPTAISLPIPRRVNSFIVHLRQAISNNDKLASLLYEYKNLIGQVNEIIPVNHSITSPGQDNMFDEKDPNYDNRLTKQLAVSIIPKSEAEKIII